MVRRTAMFCPEGALMVRRTAMPCPGEALMVRRTAMLCPGGAPINFRLFYTFLQDCRSTSLQGS